MDNTKKNLKIQCLWRNIWENRCKVEKTNVLKFRKVFCLKIQFFLKNFYFRKYMNPRKQFCSKQKLHFQKKRSSFFRNFRKIGKKFFCQI